MEQKQIEKKKTKSKKKYLARLGSPFRKEDAQEIGEFIESCKDKTTNAILEEVKKNPESKIYQYIYTVDDLTATELFRLQTLRNIINHIEIDVIQIGDREPVKLNMSICAFHSIKNPKRYVSFEEGMENKDYRVQIIGRARGELNGWVKRYDQYSELSEYTKVIKKLLDK